MKEKHVILYFTGTHNSLMAADMIGEAIEKEGLGECRKLALSQFNTKEMLDVETLGHGLSGILLGASKSGSGNGGKIANKKGRVHLWCHYYGKQCRKCIARA